MFLKHPQKLLRREHPRRGLDRRTWMKCVQMTPTIGKGLWSENVNSFYRAFYRLLNNRATSKDAEGSVPQTVTSGSWG